MKKLLLLFLLSTSFFCFSQSDFQPPEMDYGKDIEKHLKQDSFEIVDGDDVIVLFDKGTYSFTVDAENIALEEEYHMRMKILTKEGLDKANLTLRYIHDDRFQDIRRIKASSYNWVNGKIEEERIRNKDVFEQELDDRITKVSFAIPNVKVGSVIEYTYKRISRNTLNAPTWYFTTDMPTLYSELTFNIPTYFRYSQFMRGPDQLDHNIMEESKVSLGAAYGLWPSTLHRWGISNIEPMKDEQYVANINDFKTQIEFRLNQTMFPGETVETYNTTWENLNAKILENDYLDQFKDKKLIEEIVEEVTAGIDTDEGKIRALYEYVTDNVEVKNQGWVYTSKPVKRVLKDKEGNLADVNLLLVNMLKTANFDAKPFLISTREDGYVFKMYPSMNTFTYPVVLLTHNDNEYVLNATSEYRPYYLARPSDYNMDGWVVDETDYGWKNVEQLTPKSQRQYVINASLKETGEYAGNVQVTSTDFLSVSDRVSVNSDGVETRLKNLYGNSGENADIAISETEMSDVNNSYDHFDFSARFSIDNYCQKVNDFIYVNPVVFDRESENPFTKKERTYPVDFSFPYSINYSINIKIPEGYRLQGEEKPRIVKLGQSAVFMRSVSQMKDQLIITIRNKMDKTVFWPKEYPYLQEYMDNVVKEMNKQLVLKKE